AGAPGDAVAHPGNAPEFLRVEMEQIAGTGVLIAMHRRRRRQAAAARQAARLTIRAAVAALTPTAAAICAHVQRWWRSTWMPSWIAGAVARGLACGRLERSCNPLGPSAR